MRNDYRRSLAAGGLLFCVLTVWTVAAEKDVWTGINRVVAIGDVHGDYGQFVQLLRAAELIDRENRWSGRRSHLVQTGDVLGRGAESRKVMDLLMKLEGEAVRSGGRVHALIGNHEAMNLYGDLRYVSPGEYAAFRNSNSDRIRDLFFQQHVAELKQFPPAAGLPALDEAYRNQWEGKTPLGMVEHRYEFGPEGTYGRWIRGHNAIVKIDGTVFMHGGIGPSYASHTISQINNRVRKELTDFSKLQGGIVTDEEGPLWYRGLALGDEDILRTHVEEVLERHAARRIVIGHTVTQGTVMPRFDGRIVGIDVGLSQHYGGPPACLLIEDGQLFTLHRGKKLALPADSGQPLLDYLRKAAQLDPSPSPIQKQIAQLEGKLASSAN